MERLGPVALATGLLCGVLVVRLGWMGAAVPEGPVAMCKFSSGLQYQTELHTHTFPSPAFDDSPKAA
jgi:hypothetical protein